MGEVTNKLSAMLRRSVRERRARAGTGGTKLLPEAPLAENVLLG